MNPVSVRLLLLRLAQKIVDGSVPQKLQGKQVIRLDVVSLVQGTGIRGQFEERMQKLMEEIRQRQDVILFIDEIHEIVGAGNAGDGNMDAGNILKPALARGELQLVGATTLNEYRIIEKDAALERRMQPVKVDEPTVEETITILRGIQPKYQDYHHVKYTDELLLQLQNCPTATFKTVSCQTRPSTFSMKQVLR